MSKDDKDGYVQSTAVAGEQFSDNVQLDDFTATVANKWQGSSADKHDMVVLGRTQVLRVSSYDIPFPGEALAKTRHSETSASSPCSVSRLS